MIGPLLGYYLAALFYDRKTVGFVISSGLAGAAAATACVTLVGSALQSRTALLAVTGLSLAGGTVAALASSGWVVAAAAFVGMLNGMGRDRGACLVLEQAMLPRTAGPADRTRAFAWYSVMQDAGTAVGGLASALPGLLRTAAGMAPLPALRLSMGAYLALTAVTFIPYLLLSRDISRLPAGAGLRMSRRSRGLLARLCALFAVDSVAGGFLTATFLTLFFRARFGISEQAMAALFATKSILNAISHLGAAWLAQRVGLVNTMVFTHIPSSVVLLTVTVAPTFPVAAALFLLREGLVEMDVPTRTSYVMAVVQTDERPFASGVTHLVRMAGWAIAPAIGGLVAASADSLAAPLWIGAGMKISYDVLLYAAFRGIRAPEEQ